MSSPTGSKDSVKSEIKKINERIEKLLHQEELLNAMIDKLGDED